MSSTSEDLERQVVDIAADLEMLVELMNGREFDMDDEDDAAEVAALVKWFDDHGIEVDEDTDFAESAREYLDQDILSIEVHGTRSIGDTDWSVTGLDVVFCVGGPHIELDTRSGDVVGYWGGDRVRRSVSSDVVAFFDSMIEDY